MAVDTLPDVAEVLAPLARLLVAVVREEAAKQARGDEGPRYYDKDTAPMGPTAFLRLASQGAFPTFKVGKKIHARREDVHAWIEAQEGARPRAPRPPPMARELAPVDVNALSPAEAHELAMGRNGPQRTQGSRRRNGPPTQRSR